ALSKSPSESAAWAAVTRFSFDTQLKSGSAIVFEGGVEIKVGGSNKLLRRLQVILALAGDPHLISLDARLDFELAVFDNLGNLLHLFGGEATLDGDLALLHAGDVGLKLSELER